MVLKPKTCLLLFFGLYLFLGFISVSHSYKYGEPEQELTRCQLSCVKQLQPYSKQAECQEQCVEAYRVTKEEEGSFDDPQGRFKRCQKQCQEQEQSQQQQCRRTCLQEYEQQQREQEERARHEGGKGRGDENPQVEDPQQRYEQCQEQCRRSRTGDQEECQSQCRKVYERQKREQERERGEGGRGKGDDNPQVEDPRQRYEQCQEECRSSRGEQQPQCQTQCRKDYEQQQREQEEREPREGGRGEGNDNPQEEDPQRQYERCQEECRSSRGGKQQQCQTQCQKEYEQQQREQEERERREAGRGKGDDNPQLEDPQQQYERCQEECRSSRGGEQQKCQTQCRKEYERQQRQQEEQERREGGRGRGDDNPKAEGPQQRYERCQEQCRSSHRGEQQQQQCHTQCRKKFERQQREQEREHREGGKGRGDDNPQKDPQQQYEQCQELCREYHPRTGAVQEQCQKGCRKEYEEQRREQEEQQRGGPGSTNHHEEQRYQQCRQKCQSHERGQRRQYCLQQCERKYQEEQREHGHKHGEEGNIRERGEEQQENNPYYFEAQRFESIFRTQQGHLRVLERFSERSELLQGIENYRLAILEANPNTFIIPHHYDAESVFAVLQGKGIITLVQQDRRESFNLKQGDVIRVPAGTTLYLINHDNNNKLQVAKLFQPVNTPGRFESYFGVGGENPKSFYRAFSNEVLQAALNGVIIKASQEQIKALSRHVSSSSRKSKGPFNLLKEKPLFSNELGQFFEASPDNYEQLRNLDVSVAFMNINQGAMIAPYYNSKSTKLVMVVEGTGRFEMACPHLAGQTHGSQGRREQERGGAHYQRVRAQLSVGDAFVIPAGHPISIIASENEDLKLVGFGINAKNNQKNFLAGQEDNVWKHVQSEAKELSFKLPAREVEEIFRNQKQSYFLPGPGQHQEREEGGSRTLASTLMNFVGFF